MRSIRLGRTFDAVLVHDAVDYVTSEDDLRLVIETAFAHCRPGGLAVFAPDHTAETFRAGTGGGGGGDDGTGRQASFRERISDPDPGDDWILAEYEFTLAARRTARSGWCRKRTGSGSFQPRYLAAAAGGCRICRGDPGSRSGREQWPRATGRVRRPPAVRRPERAGAGLTVMSPRARRAAARRGTGYRRERTPRAGRHGGGRPRSGRRCQARGRCPGRLAWS